MPSPPRRLEGLFVLLAFTAPCPACVPGQDGEAIFVQEDPGDGKLVEEIYHRDRGGSSSVFVLLGDGTVRYWPQDDENERFAAELERMAQPAGAGRFVLSPEGRRIVRIRPAQPGDADRRTRVAFPDDAARDDVLASGGRATFHLSEEGKAVAVLRSDFHRPQRGSFEVHDRGGGRVVELPGVRSLRFSADGRRIAVTDGSRLRVYDGSDLSAPRIDVRRPGAFVLDEGGSRVAVLRRGAVGFVDDDGEIRSYPLGGDPLAVAFGPGDLVAVVDRRALRLLDLTREKPLFEHRLSPGETQRGTEYRSVDLALLPGGRGAIVVAGKLTVERVPRRGAPIGRATASVEAYDGRGERLHDGQHAVRFPIRHWDGESPSVRILPGGEWVRIGTRDGVRMWEVPR